MNTELSIIIVNWNGEKFLPDCLRSIAENPPKVSYEVIVIDNKSSDGSLEWLNSDEAKSLFPDGNFRLIESHENLGFGRANNLVIELTTTPYVFLLNPDTIVKPKAIDQLLETLNSDDKIGAVAPKLLNEDGSLQPNIWGFPPTPITILFDGFKLYKLLPRMTVGNWLYRSHWTYDETRPVPMFSGAAIMLKRLTLNQTKGFDSRFFMYGEDLEFCVRLNRYGWKTVFEPRSQIIHLGGQSSAQRWGTEVTRLKEEEAFIGFQQKCLPSYLWRLNIIAKLLVLSSLYLKWTLTNVDTLLIRQLIKLQITSLHSIKHRQEI